jgi:hypothetical protein
MNCILQSNGRCKKTTGRDDGNCFYNEKTNRCNKKKSITKRKSKKSKKSLKQNVMYLNDDDRLDRLNSNILFNNTEFEINKETYEIKFPNIDTKSGKCKKNETEFFFNCFKELGSGSFGTFYSPLINDYFGIRNVDIDEYSMNEIKVLTLLRKKFYDFIFCTHMYGWIKYKRNLYIIIEKKHSDIFDYILKNHLKNKTKERKSYIKSNTKMFINIIQILTLQLKEFQKYGLYHQDLHQGNVLVLKLNKPINIMFKGYTFRTDIIPYIHDFDYTGIRDKKLQKIYKLTNKKWENTYDMINIKNESYLYDCYDIFEIYNNLMELFILKKNNTFYFLLDFEYIINTLFNDIYLEYIYVNGDGRYITYKNKNIVIEKDAIKEYSVNIINYNIKSKKEEFLPSLQISHKKGCSKNNIVINYSTLNANYKNIDKVCEMYSLNNLIKKIK